jgi:uncharacterized protein (TIGR02996 family)
MTATPCRRPDPGLIRAVLKAPADPLPRMLLADWYREHMDDETADALMAGKWMPVDDLTAAACVALADCDNLLGGFAERFIRDVCRPIADGWRNRTTVPTTPQVPNDNLFMVRATASRVTPKQLLWVWRLVWSHRGALRSEVLSRRAAELLTGVVEDFKP